MAGPEVHPINLRSFPADAAASRTGRPGPVLITRQSAPVNIIGGYKFPGAPAVDLGSPVEQPERSRDTDLEPVMVRKRCWVPA